MTTRNWQCRSLMRLQQPRWYATFSHLGTGEVCCLFWRPSAVWEILRPTPDGRRTVANVDYQHVPNPNGATVLVGAPVRDGGGADSAHRLGDMADGLASTKRTSSTDGPTTQALAGGCRVGLQRRPDDLRLGWQHAAPSAQPWVMPLAYLHLQRPYACQVTQW